MIGVISKVSEKEVVKEFFELFKTPWDFYHDKQSYDVVLATTDVTNEMIDTKLLILYRSQKTQYDEKNGIKTSSLQKMRMVEYEGNYIPIYGNILTFHETEKSLIKVREANEAAGIENNKNGKKVLRIGFDLFQEINFLLSSGQPAEYAHIPTLEIHIDMLREWILRSGILLLEIPPVPAGYSFMTCLTHDVDFAGIRNHKFDHTMFGFLYRALIVTFIGVLSGKTSWGKLLKNLKAVFSLPFVYLGIVKDFMVQFDRYMEIERGLPSTFFFVPYKNDSGQDISGRAPKKRATKYDIMDVIPEVKKLVSCGCEVGLHGIDAWCDPERGSEELERISQVVGDSGIGVRMHWLYFSENSSKALEEAGFVYDSTLGYNDAVGYRSGTTQIFCLPGTFNIFELSLNIMDTAMLYPKRMNLSESIALQLCKKLISDMRTYGGVFTINWHERSLAPERNWDKFYIKLLQILRSENVWFATAKQAVSWFEKRRSIHFTDLEFSMNEILLKLTSINDKNLPDLLLRVHNPQIKSTNTEERTEDSSCCNRSFIDIPWSGKSEIERDMLKHFNEAYQKTVVI